MFESGHADSPGQALDEQARHDEGLSVSLHQAGPIPLAADFACGPGELLGLVGPSGSGKTTLLRAIAGLTEVASGYIRCGGESWFDAACGHSLSVQARRIGFVFQDYALFPHLSARDNVLLAVEGDDIVARRATAEAWLSRVRLEGLEDRLPDQLSGGQRQRVAVARALARKPQVLLLDEPFSAVDQVTRRRLQRELALLRETLTIPMVLVTHDLEEASALADRLCVLHGGKTLQSGTPETLFRTPDTPQIARLLDRHNVFSGEVVEAHGERRLAWGPYRLEVGQGLEAFAPGQSLHWYLPPSDVVLHRRGRPSNGERENPVEGWIQEMVVLGGVAQITLAFDHGAQTLRFEITTHAARRNALARGEVVQVSLLAAAIHLMPDKAQ